MTGSAENDILSDQEIQLLQSGSASKIYSYIADADNNKAGDDDDFNIINIVQLFFKLFTFFVRVAKSKQYAFYLSSAEKSLFTENTFRTLNSKIKATAENVKDDVICDMAHASVRKMVIDANKDSFEFWYIIYCLAIFKGCGLNDPELNKPVLSWFVNSLLPKPLYFFGFRLTRSYSYRTYQYWLVAHSQQLRLYPAVTLFNQGYAQFLGKKVIALQQNMREQTLKIIKLTEQKILQEDNFQSALQEVFDELNKLIYETIKPKSLAHAMWANVFQIVKKFESHYHQHAEGPTDIATMIAELKCQVTQSLETITPDQTLRQQSEIHNQNVQSSQLLSVLHC